ncbi:MAG: CoA pyrophosphatase [Eubacterium sp.]|nr:CoA pyrophosphatase [Eubacterium sp.]
MRIKDIEDAFRGRETVTIGHHKEYAVLVPFVEDKEMSLNADEPEVSLLYEVRAAGIMQPGEVCFPGGHVEDGETPEECAVRETCEELGITGDDIRIIARCDTLYGSGSFTLYTFIGELISDNESTDTENAGADLPGIIERLKPDPEEVSDVFTVPMKDLIEKEPEHYTEHLRPDIDPDFPYDKVGISRDYPWRTSDYEIPVYEIDGHIIWGMTARITERVVKILHEHD